jgi:hypothetical protein
MLILKVLAVWLLILVCAVVNGAFREGVLVPRFGSLPAYVVSGVLLSLCIVAVSTALVSWFGQLPVSSYLLLGILWLILTLAFEFGVGHFLRHKTWPQLFEAYTFQGGNLWPIVLIVTTLAPLLAAYLRGLLPGVPK